MRRTLVALALVLGVTVAMTPACEDDSVYRSGDPPPPTVNPDGGTPEGGAAGTGGAPADTDAANDL